MRICASLLAAVAALAACDARTSRRPHEAAPTGPIRPFTVTRAQVATLSDPTLAGLADVLPELEYEAPDDESKVVLAQTVIEAWIAMIEKADRVHAERELARASVSVDTSCGSAPACAVDRVDAILRARPRTMTFRRVGKGERVWMNVLATDFEDAHIVSAAIQTRVDFNDRGDATIAELGVSIEPRQAAAAGAAD
jgi:hypothetical protein